MMKHQLIPTTSPSTKKSSITWILFRDGLETIILSLIIFLLMRQVVQNYRIEKQSMEPTFCAGQFILANKLAYVLGEPKRGDVVIFHNPDNQDEDYIKRIMGLPGDTVEIRDQQIWINGQALEEPYIANKILSNQIFGPVLIEPGRLFVIGDNRPNSTDSRGAIGQLSQELLVGKAWLRVWPFDRWGLVEHFSLGPNGTSESTSIAAQDSCPINQ